MSLHMYTLPEVYHSSWIEMKRDIPMRYEIDQLGEQATLFFGQRDAYVLTLSQHNLDQLLELGTQARQALSEAATNP